MFNFGVNFLLGYLEKLDKKTVIDYIDNNRPLLPVIQNAILKNSISIVRFILRAYWKKIDKYLHNGDYIIQTIVSKRPDLKDVLESEKGRQWIYEQLRQIYDFLYKFTWG